MDRITTTMMLSILLFFLVRSTLESPPNITAGNSTSTDLLTPTAPPSHEESLFENLFTKYNKNARPNYNYSGTSEAVVVELGLQLRRIEYLDEKRETLLFHGTTRLRWRDPRLKWNPEEYGQLNDISYSSFALWIPDILLANQADRYGTQTFEHVLANVFHDGEILLATPTSFKVYCGMDFGKWPYDEQTCVIEFESFTHDGTRVDLQMMGGNESIAAQVLPFASNNEWTVLGMRATKLEKVYDCCRGKYHSVYFSIHLQRNQHFYRPLLLTPIIIILFSSWLLFLLPFESTAKLIFGGMELLFTGGFAAYLKTVIPVSVEVLPHIVVLTLNTMLFILLALFGQVGLQWLSRRNVRMHLSLRSFILEGVGRICCMKPGNAYMKPTSIQIPIRDQEIDNFEMEDTGDTLLLEKNRQDWLTLSTVLNRIAFALYITMSLVVLI